MILPSLDSAGPYTVSVVDPPWMYSGSPDKDQAAGKHYALMSTEAICALPVRALLAKRAIVYLWATGPKLDQTMQVGAAWGLHYRGVAFVWVKTTQAGKVITGQGVRPSITKPTTELVLAFSTVRTGRPLPVLDESVGQVVLAPRPGGVHSAKPEEVQDRIELLHGEQRRLEMFARRERPGWDAWGHGVPQPG